MAQPEPSKRGSRFAAQHRVQRRSGYPSIPGDLALAHAGVESLRGESLDGVAVRLCLASRIGACAPMPSNLNANVFAGVFAHACIVLDNANAA
jgi:hypothetical protein